MAVAATQSGRPGVSGSYQARAVEYRAYADTIRRAIMVGSAQSADASRPKTAD